MKGKTTLKMGARRRFKRDLCKRRSKKGGAIGFQQAVAQARICIRGTKGVLKAVKLALAAIGNTKVRAPRSRVLRIPKSGGILLLIPIYPALGALGSLSVGAAAVIRAIAEAKKSKN